MTKAKIPPKLLSWFRDQNIGIDKLPDFLELLGQVMPVFVVNPTEVPVAVTDPDIGPLTVFQQQADATLSQANPVSGTKYTVLDTTTNVRIISIAVRCTWTVQPSPLEIHITIDGQTITHAGTNPVSDDWLFIDFTNAELNEATQLLDSSNAELKRRAFAYEGRSVKVEAEITGGTVSNLSARVKYARIP